MKPKKPKVLRWIRFIYRYFLNSRIFLSVLNWERAYTAHRAAGIHPKSVICNIRQIIPDNGRPIVKNTINGKKIARSKRIVISLYSLAIL